jgi:type VI secretion system protein ImpF
MADAGPTNIQPSLLDRLIDDDPERAIDVQRSRSQQLTALRNSVRRDLEALLNSHRCCIALPDGLQELRKSVLDYGIEDFLSVFAGKAEFGETFRKSLEDTIKCFEPRFITVSVKLRDDGDRRDRTLRFRIDALMYAEPAPEPVSFDSRLDPASHDFEVTGRSDG